MKPWQQLIHNLVMCLMICLTVLGLGGYWYSGHLQDKITVRQAQQRYHIEKMTELQATYPMKEHTHHIEWPEWFKPPVDTLATLGKNTLGVK